MNSLSWLLYFAGVSETFSRNLINLGIYGLIVAAVVATVGVIVSSLRMVRNSYDEETDMENKAKYLVYAKAAVRKSVTFVWVPVVLILVGSAIPPKNTLYLIAASEVGEEVVTSPTMSKAIEALNRVLDNIGKRPAK